MPRPSKLSLAAFCILAPIASTQMTRSEVSLRSQTTPLLEFGFTFNVSGVHISWLSAKKQWITQHLNERRRRPPSSLNLVRMCRASRPVVGAPSRNQVRLCRESRHVVEAPSLNQLRLFRASRHAIEAPESRRRSTE